MVAYLMTSASAERILLALTGAGVRPVVGGGWAIDALLGRETREHGDLDLWIPAEDLEPLLPVAAELAIDRLLPWGGDRPWVIVLHDGGELRVDLHMYERIGDGFLHYGSVVAGHRIPEEALEGRGRIGTLEVTCDSPEWALQCKSGHAPRDVDLADIPLLCEAFGLEKPAVR